jgi:RHS repeat-associated protein
VFLLSVMCNSWGVVGVFASRVVCGVGVLVSGVLVAGLGASPASATTVTPTAVAEGAAGSAVVGGFSVGEGSEALVDERSGGLSVSVPLGAGAIAWSSASAGVDEIGFGPGWRIAGVGTIDVTGGLRVFPGTGGVYEADASTPSGLRDYVRDDLRFRVTSGVLPGRADGVVGERAYGFVLEELGGSTAYFAEDGSPIARVNAGGRLDWEFDAAGRLARTVDADGVVSVWDWADPAGVRVTTGVGTGAELVYVVDVSRGFVSQVTDPVGGVTRFTFDRNLLTQVSGVSGAVTEVSWQTLPDGTPAVDRVRVVDASTGVELSAREWDAVSGTASGYPAYRSEGELFSSGDPGYRYSTVVSDGHTRVISEYNSLHLLINRHLEVDTPTGPVVVQEQALTYPDTADGGVPPHWDLPEQYALPTDTAVLFDAAASSGGRTVQAGFVFDTFGRETQRTDPDGTTTSTVYDSVVPAGKSLPVGLPLLVTRTAPDGLISQTRYELNDARTAAVVQETFTGSTSATDPNTGEVVWSRTGRVERDVAADGFVTAERVFGQGGTGTPVTTTFDRVVDHAVGTVTGTQTTAVGTGAEQTVSGTTSLVTDQTLTRTDPVGNTTVAGYDVAGRQTTLTDPSGRTVSTRYRTVQVNGVNQTITTTPDGVEVTETRDVLGRVVQVSDNILDGAPAVGHVRVVETRAYPAPGVTEVTDAYGNTTSTRQDVLGREVETTAPNGLTKITEYDDTANTVTSGLTATGTLADAETTTTLRRDGRDQVVETTGTREDQHPVLTQTAGYDGFGRATRTSDGIVDTTVVFDEFSNPETTTLTPAATPVEGMGVADLGAGVGAPVTATRRFDQYGVSVEKTLSNGEQSRSGGFRVLDERGRTLTETAPDGTVTTVTHTVDDLVETVTTSYGQETVNTYDPTTRALVETVTTSPVGVTVSTGFAYDDVTGAVLGVFDPTDRENTEIRYTYDAFGNTLSTTYPDGNQITHTYNPHGRMMSTTDVAGNITAYEYNTLGLPVTAVQTDVEGTEVARVGYMYDDHGRVTTLTRGNTVETAYTYTSANLVATETTTKDREPQETRTYAYNPAGQLVSRTDTIHDDTIGIPGSTHTVYTYDAHNRLIGSAVHAGVDTVTQHTAYTVTVSGDIDTETVTHSPGTAEEFATSRQFVYGLNGTLTGISTTHPDGSTSTAVQEYDAAGNLTRAAVGSTYTYNAANRQTGMTTPTGEVITTSYWASGQRANLTTADSAGIRTTGFYWDGTDLINDTHVAGEVMDTASYLLGTGSARHSRTTDSGGMGYFTHDRHGNVSSLTDPSGTPTTRYTYSDYGTATLHTDSAVDGDIDGSADAPVVDTVLRWGDAAYQPFQYAGEYTNPTGTQHLQAREYNPATMRFTTADTAQLHNTYAYADLNPIMNVDPSGHTALPDWANALIAGLGVALSIIGAIATALTPFLPLAILGLIPALYGTAVEATHLVVGIAKATGTTLAIDHQALEYASWAAAAAGGAEAAAVGIAKLAGKLSTKLSRGAGGIDWADVPSDLSAERLTALQVMFSKKTGARKSYFHGTDYADSIVKGGFDPGKLSRGEYGAGAYTARQFRATMSYGESTLVVHPRITTAVKVERLSGVRHESASYGVRDPRWRKGDGVEGKFLRTMSGSELSEYVASNKVDAVYVKSNPTEVLQYLIFPRPGQSDGVLPAGSISAMTSGQRNKLIERARVDVANQISAGKY